MKKILGNNYVQLNILLLVYSFSSVLSKIAANSNFLSAKYIICYCGIIFLLGIYAIVWQQIIKRMPLTNAYACKSVTIIWGLIWGIIFFSERISVFKILGCLLVISGIVLFAFGGVKDE